MTNKQKSLVTVNGKQINTTVNTILVKMDKPPKVSTGGIIIPDTAKLKTDFSGTVVAISRSEEKTGMIRVGDRVLLSKNEKRVVPTDDARNEYRMYNKKSILLHVGH